MKVIDGQNDWVFGPDDIDTDIDLDDLGWEENVKGLKTTSDTIGGFTNPTWGWDLSIKGKVLYQDDQYTVVVLYYYSGKEIDVLLTEDFDDGVVERIDIDYFELSDEAKQEIVKEKI